MNRTIRINDAVLNVGTCPATTSRITSIRLCEQPGMKEGIPCSFVSAADMNRIFVTLDNGQTAFGYQLDRVPHESVPASFHHFAGWFVERYDLTSFPDRSLVCRVLASEFRQMDDRTGNAEGFDIPGDERAARISATCLRLRHAYRHRITPHTKGFNELVQRVSAAFAEHRATVTQPSTGSIKGVLNFEYA